MRSDDRQRDRRQLTRREAIGAGLATAAGVLTLGRALDAAPSPGPYGPFKMALQSYSLRGLKEADGKPSVDEALRATKGLGLAYWESYPAHFPLDVAKAEAYKKRAAEDGVTVLGYGVNRFTNDHEANRKLFEFAKAMGFAYLSADPNPDAFGSLDRLVEEYGVAIGIHNHGPGHRYAKIDTIAAAIKDHHPKIGCCIDTGHFLRSREDPVRAVEVFGTRTYGVHLKDVKDAVKFTVVGQGDLRTADLLKALAKIGYDYNLALEYEENPANPLAEIRECLDATRKAAATLPGA
jgi:sugar phosphate isomerase/epimerase